MACLVLAPAVAHAEEPSIPSVIEKRWSVSTGYGVALARPRTDDAEIAAMIDFQLAFRFRIIPELQLGLVVDGAVDNKHGFAGLALEVRYSFAAERPWHPYLEGAAGFSSAGGVFLQGGLGVERRFISWAFSLEAHVARAGGGDNAFDDFERFGVLAGGLDLAAHYNWGGSRKRRRFVP